MAQAAPDALQQRWLHSHEEDTDDQMVFRPASFRFPPSRGRAGFDLKSNGAFTGIGIAPGDGPALSDGTWTLDGDHLHFFAPSSADPTRTLRILSADSNRLVVAK